MIVREFPDGTLWPGLLVIAAPAAIEHERHQTAARDNRKEHPQAQHDSAVNGDLPAEVLPSGHHIRKRKHEEPEQGGNRNDGRQPTAHAFHRGYAVANSATSRLCGGSSAEAQLFENLSWMRG